jgi:PAS domain S-box-containing protein
MRKLVTWYKNTNLSSRVIISMNTAIFVSILIISIIATINRQKLQIKEASAFAASELKQIATLLSFAADRRLEDFHEVINTKTLYNTGYISFIKSSGDVVLGRHYERQNISNHENFRQMRSKPRGQSVYTHPITNEVHYQYFEYYQPKDIYIVVTLEKKEFLDKPVINTLQILFFALIFTWITFSLVNYFIMKTITTPINGLVNVVKQLGKGDLPEKFDYDYKDEVGQMAKSVNELVDGLRQTAVFADEMGKNNFDHSFTPLSENDVLGNALLDMRKSLKTASDEEKIRKAEDEKRNWVTHGLARFGDILRQNNDNMQNLSFNIIKNLVDYLKINQGGIFIVNDMDKEKESFLELTACYAYDRRKYLEKKIHIGEGLVGTCYLERETIYMSKIPDNYIKITSGLGDENPGTLLLIPLKLNEKIYGVIELASFTKFERYQIEFVEKIGESIASTISSVKINTQTAMLLQKSQQQAEEMSAQEEEMRQNMEELTATQEAMAEKEMENLKTIESLQNENENKSLKVKSIEEELNNTLENCPDGIVKCNSNGEVLFYNKAAKEIWGYTKSEVVGKDISKLVCEKHQNFIKDYIDKDIQSIIIRHASGELIPVSLTLVSIRSTGDLIHTCFVKEIKGFKIENDQNQINDPVLNDITNLKDSEIIEYPEEEEMVTEEIDDSTDNLLKSEPTDTQKAWSLHMDKKGKQFKKGRKS